MISACCGKLLVVLREFYAHFQTSPCSKRAPESAERHMKWTQKLHFLCFNSLNTTLIMRSWKNSSVFKSILPTFTNMVLLKESSLHLILRHCGQCSKQFSFWNFTFSFLGWMSVYFPSTTFLFYGGIETTSSLWKMFRAGIIWYSRITLYNFNMVPYFWWLYHSPCYLWMSFQERILLNYLLNIYMNGPNWLTDIYILQSLQSTYLLCF